MIVICPACDHPVTTQNGTSGKFQKQQGKCSVCATVLEVTVRVVRESPLTVEQLAARKNINKGQQAARTQGKG